MGVWKSEQTRGMVGFQTASGAPLEGHGREFSVRLLSVIVMFSPTTFSCRSAGKV